MNSYYENNKNKINDDFYYYERPFRIAMRIQYRELLKLGNDNTLKFYDWVKESGYNKTPQEALFTLEKITYNKNIIKSAIYPFGNLK